MRFLVGVAILAATVAALPNAGVPVVERDPEPVMVVRTTGKKPFRILRNRQDFTAQANKVIPVVVGGPQDTYAPNVVTAAIGDIVQFQFSNGNHTVTQSTADAACAPLQATVATAIHSGHIPFVDGQTTVGTFNMPVTTADTMFLYCATGPHCQEGQVMVINPTSDVQIVDYVKASQQTTESIDGTIVVGGTVGTLDLAAAAFVPAPVEAAAPPAASAPATTPAPDVAAVDAAEAPIPTTTITISAA